MYHIISEAAMDVDASEDATGSERDKTLQILKEVVGSKAMKPAKDKKSTFK